MVKTKVSNVLRSFEDVRKRTPIPMSMDGHFLEINDRFRLAYSYVLFGLIFQDVSAQADDQLSQLGVDYRVTLPRKRLNSLLHSLAREDAAEVQSSFKGALLLLRHLPLEKGFCFKSRTDRTFDRWLVRRLRSNGVCSTTARELLKPFLAASALTCDPEIFRLTNDLCQFFCRLTLKSVDWIEEKAAQDYVDFEEKLHNNEYDADLVDGLRAIINDWFQDFDVKDLVADHGYGATAEVKRSVGTEAKYIAMKGMTLQTYYLMKAVDWRPPKAWPGLTALSFWLHHEMKLGHPVPQAADLVSRVQFVPKGLDKKRTVCMEPTCNMFFQKILANAFDRHFRRHPEMQIDLHHQEYNRWLCAYGSLSREFGTIDLSNASDSVSWTLVREIFRDLPDLLRLLTWCRTTKAVLPDGRVVALEKFAPMGSALCFPIECTVFSAIVRLAQKRCRVRSNYRIYGDDIVCNTRVFDEVITLLKAFNFEPNSDKSYGHGSRFTESCGVETVFGRDVSPIRLSRKFDPSKWWHYYWRKTNNRKDDTLLQLDSMYDLGNEAAKRGYKRLRKAVISTVQDSVPYAVFSHNFEHGFFTSAPELTFTSKYGKRLYTAKERCSNWLRYVRLWRNTATVAKGDDTLRYSKCLETYQTSRRQSLSSFEDRIDSAVGSATVTSKLQWYPFRELDTWFWE